MNIVHTRRLLALLLLGTTMPMQSGAATITCPVLEVVSTYPSLFSSDAAGSFTVSATGSTQIIAPASGVLNWATQRQTGSGVMAGWGTFYIDDAILTNKWHARLKYTPTGAEVPTGAYLVGIRLSDNTSQHCETNYNQSDGTHATWYGFQYCGRLTFPSDSSTDLGVAEYAGGINGSNATGTLYGTSYDDNGGVVGTKWIFSKVRFTLQNGEWLGDTWLYTTVFAQGHAQFYREAIFNYHSISRDEQVEVYSIAAPRDMLRGSFDPNGGNNSNPGGEQVVVDFRTPNTTTVVYQAVLQVEPDGGDFKYENPTPDTPGDYDLSFQYDRCLRRTVTVDTTDLETAVNLELINGDINVDNAIDIGDYAALSYYYEMDDSDEEAWLAPDPESLLAPVDCDLNGDGVVDIGDYSIISENMDEVGDE